MTDLDAWLYSGSLDSAAAHLPPVVSNLADSDARPEGKPLVSSAVGLVLDEVAPWGPGQWEQMHAFFESWASLTPREALARAMTINPADPFSVAFRVGR